MSEHGLYNSFRLLHFEKRFLVFPQLWLFLVFVLVNLADVPQVKMRCIHR